MVFLSAILGVVISTGVLIGTTIVGSVILMAVSARKQLKNQFAALVNYFGENFYEDEAPLNYRNALKNYPQIHGELFGRGFSMYMTKESRDDHVVFYTHFTIAFKAAPRSFLIIKKENRLHRRQKRRGKIVEHEIGWGLFDKLYLLETEDGHYLDDVFDDHLADLFITAHPHLRGYFEVHQNELIYTEALSINSHKARLRIQKIIELSLFLADRLEIALSD